MNRPVRFTTLRPAELLTHILEDQELVSAVQSLEPKALSSLIQHIGLEDASELVSLASTEQLSKIFDDDLWRSERPGKDEAFDADRFALWLEVMLEAEEFGRYRVVSRDHEGWNAVASILTALDQDHHPYLDRLLDRLCYLSEEYVEENGGLYQVLTAGKGDRPAPAHERQGERSHHEQLLPEQRAHTSGEGQCSEGGGKAGEGWAPVHPG